MIVKFSFIVILSLTLNVIKLFLEAFFNVDLWAIGLSATLCLWLGRVASPSLGMLSCVTLGLIEDATLSLPIGVHLSAAPLLYLIGYYTRVGVHPLVIGLALTVARLIVTSIGSYVFIGWDSDLLRALWSQAHWVLISGLIITPAMIYLLEPLKGFFSYELSVHRGFSVK